MRNLVSKNLHFFLPLVSVCIVSCGATMMPLQEISTAKQEITRAKLFNSEKYSKKEFDESKANLFLAHENIFSTKPDSKKATQIAQNSTEKARDAIKKSLPSYVKDLQSEVNSAISSASIALAESLASDLYEQATLLKAEGDEIVKNADKKLANSPSDPNIYDDYEKGIIRYKECIAVAEKARDLSLAQTQAVIDSSSDIESNFDLIEKYSNDDKAIKTKILSLREEYKKSVNLMESGNLRDGFKKAESIRISSNEMLVSTILPYAKERIKLATEKIENADKYLNSDTQKAKSSVASDNLSASKEAFNSSVDLLAKERYYDSIQQSEESIRLAEQVENSDKNPDSDSSERSSKEEEAPTEIKNEKDSYPTKKITPKVNPTASETKPKPETKTKWKKHIVQKKNPPETLWQIAADKKYLGNKELWKEIYKANKKNISNPNLIYPNQVILIPAIPNKKK